MAGETIKKCIRYLRLVILVYITASVFISSCGAAANANETKTTKPFVISQASILYAVYQSFLIPPNELSSWENTSGHGNPCVCYGIRCNSFNRVISINLSDLKLFGTISPHIARLSELERLDLSGNFLTGTIPNELAKLESLNHLDLRNNSLVGTIPKGLGDMKSLKHLDLSFNYLEGSVPEEILAINSLVSLNLKNNMLYGSIALTAQNSSLKELVLDDNLFNGTIYIHPNCTHKSPLSHFSADNNLFSGKIPYQIVKCSALQYLSFASNHFENLSESDIGAESLVVLRLGSNKLKGRIPWTLSRLVNLTVLDLSRNSLHGEIPEELARLTKLKLLNLAFNNLTGVVPFALYTAVNRLNIKGNNLTLVTSQEPTPLVTSDDPSTKKNPCLSDASLLRINSSETSSYSNPCLKSKTKSLEESSSFYSFSWKEKSNLKFLIPVCIAFVLFIIFFITLAVVAMKRFRVERRDPKAPVGFRTLDLPTPRTPRTPSPTQDSPGATGLFSPRVNTIFSPRVQSLFSPRVKSIFSPRQSPNEDNEEIFAYGIQPFSGKATVPAASFKPKTNYAPPPAKPKSSRIQTSRFAPKNGDEESSSGPPMELTIQIPAPNPSFDLVHGSTITASPAPPPPPPPPPPLRTRSAGSQRTHYSSHFRTQSQN